MKILRILIVENEMSLAMDLEMMIEKIASATFVTESVGAAKKVLHEALGFAFLDVDVTKGKTFEIAEILELSMCLLLLFRARRKTSCQLSCAASPSF
jgi:hypothetical protein